MDHLPLHTLIARLRMEGLSVDAATLLRVQEVLQLLGQAYWQQPEQLRLILAPVIAKNAQEQAKFRQVFEAYWLDLQQEIASSTSEPTVQEGQAEGTVQPPIAWHTWVGALALLGIGLAVIAFFYKGPWESTGSQSPISPEPEILRLEVSPPQIRAGDTVYFLNRSDSAGRRLYRWQWGDGTETQSTDTLLWHIYPTESQAQVQLQAVGDTSTLRRNLVIGKACQPLVDFSYSYFSGSQANRPLYVGDTLLFINRTPGRARWAAEWDFGDSTRLASPDSLVPHVYARAGSYPVRLTVGRGECTNAKTLTVEVAERPLPEREIIGSKEVIIPVPWYEKPTWYWWANLALVGLWLLGEGYFFYRSRHPVSRQKLAEWEAAFRVDDKSPYQIPFPNRDRAIALENDFYALSAELRARSEGERLVMDLPATVRQTIRQGGFPKIVNFVHSRPTEYLFLVEQTQAGNLQYRLFEAFLRLLQNEGVLLEQFKYYDHPRYLFNDQFAGGLPLAGLAQRFPGHRLVVLGRAEGFYDPLTATLDGELLQELARWPEKTLLTPAPAQHWGHAERNLLPHLPLQPATMNGWLQLLDALTNEARPGFRDLRRQHRQPASETAHGRIAPPGHPPPEADEWTLPALRAYLADEQMWQWLCALAVYPQPTWEVALALGEAIDQLDGRQTLLVTYANFYTLVQLPWLQTGRWDSRLREELLAELDQLPDLKALAYRHLRELLAEAPTVPHSPAHLEKEAQLALATQALGGADAETQAKLRYLHQAKLLPRREAERLQPLLRPRHPGPWAVARAAALLLLLALGLGTYDRQRTEQVPQPRVYTETVGDVSFTMVYVAGGTFQMGDTFSEGAEDEKPVHPVTLDGYHLGQTEVTQALWRAVMGTNPSYFKNCDQCPVENVSWDDAQDFIQKLNRLTGKKYRLPTEAQWEFAARERGRKVRFGNGQNILRFSEANFNATKDYEDPYSEVGEYRGKTTPVKTFAPNALGLYERSGNVLEWCEDDWHGDYQNAPADGRAWIDKSRGALRVFRGGDWYGLAGSCRAANRYHLEPQNRFSSLGFRLASV